MDKFELYFNDMTDEAKERFMEFTGNDFPVETINDEPIWAVRKVLKTDHDNPIKSAMEQMMGRSGPGIDVVTVDSREALNELLERLTARRDHSVLEAGTQLHEAFEKAAKDPDRCKECEVTVCPMHPDNADGLKDLDESKMPQA